MDHVKHMIGDSVDPTKSGDMKSWFFFYKWNTEGQVFFPLSPEKSSHVRAGDRLWFVMDGTVVGYVTVLKVQEDAINWNLEIWYDASDRHVAESGMQIGNNSRFSLHSFEDGFMKDALRHCT